MLSGSENYIAEAHIPQSTGQVIKRKHSHSHEDEGPPKKRHRHDHAKDDRCESTNRQRQLMDTYFNWRPSNPGKDICQSNTAIGTIIQPIIGTNVDVMESPTAPRDWHQILLGRDCLLKQVCQRLADRPLETIKQSDIGTVTQPILGTVVSEVMQSSVFPCDEEFPLKDDRMTEQREEMHCYDITEQQASITSILSMSLRDLFPMPVNNTTSKIRTSKIHTPTKAMRVRIQIQMRQFKRANVGMPCSICGSMDNPTVDHVRKFSRLCKKFLKSNPTWTWAQWRQFHRLNATLRIACAKCNHGRHALKPNPNKKKKMPKKKMLKKKPVMLEKKPVMLKEKPIMVKKKPIMKKKKPVMSKKSMQQRVKSKQAKKDKKSLMESSEWKTVEPLRTSKRLINIAKRVHRLEQKAKKARTSLPLSLPSLESYEINSNSITCSAASAIPMYDMKAHERNNQPLEYNPFAKKRIARSLMTRSFESKKRRSEPPPVFDTLWHWTMLLNPITRSIEKQLVFGPVPEHPKSGGKRAKRCARRMMDGIAYKAQYLLY